jgi:hypothetical protein
LRFFHVGVLVLVVAFSVLVVLAVLAVLVLALHHYPVSQNHDHLAIVVDDEQVVLV